MLSIPPVDSNALNRLAKHYLAPKRITEKTTQKALPRIAKDATTIARLQSAIQDITTTHVLYRGDARTLPLADSSVQLIVTSPPYWTLKKYKESVGQLGHIDSYDEFLAELVKVWTECFRVLVKGGRLIIVVGDVCLSRRRNRGRHTVVPLHASIVEQCRRIGYDNIAPIVWSKISNAVYEVNGRGGFLGKPYEPNAVIKNDIEFILMQRKPGGYRKPTIGMRLLSLIGERQHKEWFQQIWALPGSSTRNHPAPFPLVLAERLVRMFSFVGDVVLDPFVGTGTTQVAAMRCGRNSIGIEIDSEYMRQASERLVAAKADLFSRCDLIVTP